MTKKMVAVFFRTVFVMVCGFLVIPGGVLADSANLPQTGQTKCYHQDGYEIDCPDTGQDGDIRAGVAWPDPRFTDNGDGTITDNLTHLMWLKDAECFGSITWQAALDAANGFNQDPASYNCYQYNHQALDYNDWRVPNINELESLVNAGKPSQAGWLNNNYFHNAVEAWYWSSTTYGIEYVYAWVIFFGSGIEESAYGYKIYNNRVLLVRSTE